MLNKLTSSAIFLILANAVPIFGVLFWGWDALVILVLYWLESIIIGVLNIPKILMCRIQEDGILMGLFGAFRNLVVAGFFTVHYGIFTAVHGTFLADVFGARLIMEGLLSGGPILWTAATFFISHLFSMFINFLGKKEYLGRDPGQQMFSVYSRVFVMHFVVILGGFGVQAFGAPIIAVIMLIVLKTGIDLAAHKKEHEGREVVTT